MRKWVRSSIRAVSGWQSVVQQDSIEALHQYRDALVQVAGLSSLASRRDQQGGGGLSGLNDH